MINIDGIEYDIPFKVINRRAEMLYKYAERTEDGELHSELIGTYYNYDLEMGQSANNIADYAALWLKVTEPVESHAVIMPDEGGGSLFNAYFSGIKDEVKTWTESGVVYFRNLSFSVTSISPSRVPA